MIQINSIFTFLEQQKLRILLLLALKELLSNQLKCKSNQTFVVNVT